MAGHRGGGELALTPYPDNLHHHYLRAFTYGRGLGGKVGHLAAFGQHHRLWGLAVFTILTLFIIPCLYAITEDLKARFRKG